MNKFKIPKHIVDKLLLILKYVRIVTAVLSVFLIAAFVFDFGFYYTNNQERTLTSFYYFVWVFYIIVVTYRLIVDYITKEKRGKIQIRVAAIFLYLSLLPYVVSIFVQDTFLNRALSIFTSKIFFYSSIFILAVTSISMSVISLINRKTNPAAIMALSFFIVIIIGAGLLQLPKCTVGSIKFIDSLFISTSAVCVTGLSPLEISSAFTLQGQIVILLLIQIGGLGVMTLTSFFALFFMGNTGLYSQLALKDMISSDSLNSLLSTLLYILGFTLVIEIIGMFFIWINIHNSFIMTIREEFFFSLFHSVSAFCNAGFSTLQGNLGNPILMNNHNWFYLIISLLVILGGIGFPILVNFRKVFVYYIRYVWKKLVCRDVTFNRFSHVTNLNSRIVLATTLFLLVSGTFLIAMLEWNNAFAGMSLSGKLAQSFFNAVSPRTAGFTSVSLNNFCIPTILITVFLMWIGGAAQSTAGGIKVNAFAVSWFNLRAIIRGENRVNVFGREISELSIRRANATIFISLLTISVFVYALTVNQPEIPLMSVVFECFSAFGTVGSSLNTTPLLNDLSKCYIIFLMFAGRVGITTLLMSILSKKNCEAYKLPQEQIIIN